MKSLFSLLSFTLNLFVVLILISCSSQSSKDREEFIKEVLSYKDELPYNLPGTSISIIDIAVDDDKVIYTCSVGNEVWEAMSLSIEVSNSERNKARVLSNVSSDAINKMIEHGFGLKYIYESEETGETLLEIGMSAKEMKEIMDKVASGEIQPYTMIELTQIELDKMEIPAQLDEGVWLTDAYIKGSKIFYIATIENEIDASDLTNSDISEMKEGLIETLKNEELVMMHKSEIDKENIHFVYIYKDNRGKEFARIDISPYDLGL